MVEFAIAVPLFLIFLAIVYEGGALFYTYFRLSSAAFEGSRFCASLAMPLTQCFKERQPASPPPDTAIIDTTNLAPWTPGVAYGRHIGQCRSIENVAGITVNPTEIALKRKALLEVHKLIQDRVATIFYVKRESWAIRSDDEIPYCSPMKVSEMVGHANFPTIKSQYIGVVSPGNPEGEEAENACEPDPTEEEENSCSICVSAVYQGIFAKIPLEACSTSFVLSNNELVAVPFNVRSVGNTTFNYSYNYNYN